MKLLTILLFAGVSYAAISSGARWGVMTTGSDTTSAGCFVPGLGAKDVTAATDLVVDATISKKVRSVTHSFVSGDVGKFVSVTAGTGWRVDKYEIVSVSSGDATLDYSPAAQSTTGGTYDLYSAIDYANQASPQVVFSSGNSNLLSAAQNSVTLTSAGSVFTAAMVGNCIAITGGTNFITGIYQISTFTNATTVTLDHAPATAGAGSAGTGDLGGSLASPAFAAGLLTVNNVLWIQNGTYTISSASTNVANGVISGTASQATVEGYQTTRGDIGTAPLLQGSSIGTVTLVAWSGSNDTIFRNLSVDCGSGSTATKGFAPGKGSYYFLTVANCSNSGFAPTAIANCFNCAVTNFITQPAFTGNINCVGCMAKGGTATAFNLSGGGSGCWFCIADSNSGASSDGFVIPAQTVVMNSSAYNNGRDGFRCTATECGIVNVIAEGNAGTGVNFSGAGAFIYNCLVYNNATSAIVNSGGTRGGKHGCQVGTSSFFTNAAGGDFSLNNTAGAGALARGAGFPGTFAAGSTVGSLDIGAAQHTATGGGSHAYVQ